MLGRNPGGVELPGRGLGDRNMVAVTLTELGFTGRRVGAMFGISEQYVSMLRDGPAATARRG